MLKSALITLLIAAAASLASGMTWAFTEPVATTVYSAGQSVTLKWKIDPLTGISTMLPPKVQIQLLKNGTLLTPLFLNVDGAMSQLQWAIPPQVPPDNSYQLRIGTGETDWSYSARFTIQPFGVTAPLIQYTTLNFINGPAPTPGAPQPLAGIANAPQPNGNPFFTAKVKRGIQSSAASSASSAVKGSSTLVQTASASTAAAGSSIAGGSSIAASSSAVASSSAKVSSASAASASVSKASASASGAAPAQSASGAAKPPAPASGAAAASALSGAPLALTAFMGALVILF
ncbi:uncharacterized protein VTP21DRAFT_6042 [Calcarisporiella thermophila]|uniref:uncharacterized protein n=1 Tax=Calcarisporiella thermophila TaxID=911321 RepID=UPI0037424368